MERALIERARNGDHAAFTSLVELSIGRLYGVATLILRDRDAAQDAVQDALISAWRGIRALRDPNAFDAWLQRSVVRACYRQARRERRHVAVWQLAGRRMADASDDASGPLADRDEIERGFLHLSIEHRAVIVLHYYVGLPLAEVAAVLGTPEGTAKSRLHRATAALRAGLAADARQTATVGGHLA
jgi:RNA polymerase sigma-70 factor (ECF subfamily)